MIQLQKQKTKKINKVGIFKLAIEQIKQDKPSEEDWMKSLPPKEDYNHPEAIKRYFNITGERDVQRGSNPSGMLLTPKGDKLFFKEYRSSHPNAIFTAKREVLLNNLIRQMGVSVPETKILSSDPQNRTAGIVQRWIVGTPLHMHPDINHMHYDDPEYEEKLKRIFKNLDKNHLIKHLLAEYALNIGDRHLQNLRYVPSHNIVIPIDLEFGAYPHSPIDDGTQWNRGHPVADYLLHPESEFLYTPLNKKDHIEPILDNRNTVLQQIREHLLPHYFVPGKREALEEIKSRFKNINVLRHISNPKFGHVKEIFYGGNPIRPSWM